MVCYPVVVPSGAVQVQVCYPGQTGIAPTPGVPATPAQFIADENLGWNAGAVSIAPLVGDGGLQAIPLSATGVIYGLSQQALLPGYSYEQIQFGFHIERTRFRIIENGVGKTGFASFTPGQTFVIMRTGGSVRYLVNDQVVYTSLASPADEQLFADISMYAAGDQLDDAEWLALNDGAVAATEAAGVGAAEARASILMNTVSAGGVGGAVALPSVGNTHTAGSLAEGFGGRAAAAALGGQAAATAAGVGSQSVANAIVKTPSTSAASLKALQSVGASYPYDYSHAELAPLETNVTQGQIMPSYALSTNALVGITGVGTSLTGEISTSFDVSLREIDSLSADRNYGESNDSLFPLVSVGGEDIQYEGVMVGEAPVLSLYAVGHTDPLNGLFGFAPTMTLAGYSGADMSGTVPRMSLAATGVVTGVGRLDKPAPRMTLQASGTPGSIGTLDATLPSMTLSAWSGTGLRGTMPAMTLSATGTITETGTMAGRFPAFQFTATGTVGGVGSLNGVMPALEMAPTAQLALTMPVMTLDATGFAGAASVVRVLAVNVSTGKVAELANFPFEGIGLIDGVQTMVNSDGTYTYGGTVDVAAPLTASVELTATDNKSPRLKRMPYAYVYGSGDGTVKVAQTTSDGAGAAQVSDNKYHVGSGNRRAQLSRKTKARYLGLYIEADTLPLYVEGVELITQQTERRR
jgi:hypothetical protein